MVDIQTYIERQQRGRPALAAAWTEQHEQVLRNHLEQADRILAQTITTNEPPTHDQLGFLQHTLGWTMAEIQAETHRVSATMRGAE